MKILYDHEFLPTAITLLHNARHSIDISTFKAEMTTKPRGRNLHLLFGLLQEKAKAGIPVRFLISKREDNGHVPFTNLYAVRELRANDVKVRHLRHSRLCHAKVIIVDGHVGIIGSHNLSVKSCHNNFEISCFVTDSEALNRLLAIYNETWENSK